jgi:GH18 family chitinase
MKIRSVLGPALAAALLLPACGSDSSTGNSPGGAGSSSAGAPANVAGAPSAEGGAPSSVAGAPAAGAPSDGGGGAATSGGGAAVTAGAGGTSAAGAPSGGGSSGAGTGTAGSGSAGAPSTTIPDTKVVMYLPNWVDGVSYADWATKVDFKKMTHLLLAFGTAKGNDWNLAPDADVLALTKAAHAANVKVLVSIGGADDDIGICNQYHTASNIDPMVMNLDAMVKRQGLDGVDVDIERGNEMKSNGNFPQFLSKLQTTMHAEGKLVTAATAQYIAEDSGSTDPGVIAYLKSYDFLNLMIYSTNMNTYTSELNFWTTKIGAAKTKLVWGIEFGNNLSTATAKSLTTASKADGGIMIWEYSQGTEATLWPAVQSVL